MGKWFYPNVAYDARKAFAPVALLATIPSVLVVPADSPYKDARSLLAYAKANPGKVSFASAGMGTSIHLAAALLAAQAGVDLLHVPYKGSTPAAADLIAGRVSMMVDSITAQQSFIKSGRVRALGVTSLQPAPSLPGIPPLAQAADLPKFEVLTWFGLFVPSRTSPDIVKVLNTAMNEALKTPEVQKALADIGASAQGGTSQALGVLWDNEIDRWGQLIVHHRLNTQ
ncbi:Tripartite tricarboxylate transporter family receptor [Sphingopyxis flava]|uniref:Tripartite tricarboxylate transporter family receptor n=1 Tax=Sphingopyxis flava TaxID=1507287 RepID=A0A1T5F9K2_9SPHN|nr:Tripartite tricarboxylate transporter family receptor [Sphingopyxis flava]